MADLDVTFNFGSTASVLFTYFSKDGFSDVELFKAGDVALRTGSAVTLADFFTVAGTGS